jgi:DNA topoisomerase I
MEWQVSADKTRQLKAITDEAKNADTLILATDPDREGEAISWHLAEVLKKRKALPKVERVAFNAITKIGGDRGDGHPRELDEDLIDAYRPAARSTIWSDSLCRRSCGASCRERNRPAGCSRSRFG